MLGKKDKISIIGLGYVGLPLAVEFAKHYEVIGFDLNKKRIDELKKGFDRTNEVDNKDLKSNSKILFTSEPENLSDAKVYIVTVPTPIDEFNVPDLDPLKSASKIIGQHISLQDTVIYESTVYPGVTEEICIPILESESSLILNKDQHH